MSTGPSDSVDEADAGPPPDPDTLRGMFHDPGVRNYLFAGLAGLAMVFVIMFQNGSDVGGLLLVLLGGAGMVLRWPAAPGFFLLLLLWFLLFPFGIPDLYEDKFALRSGHLRIADMLLAFSVVVYMSSHYRIHGLTKQAIPFEQRYKRKGEKRTRRPVESIRPGEIVSVLVLTAGAVAAGQLIWLFATKVEIDVLAPFPLKLAESRRPLEYSDMNPGMTRFILLTGVFFFAALFARLLFGYWRLRLMSPAEGGMVLQDAGWDETRRERTRIEKWRAWAKAKLFGKTEAKPNPPWPRAGFQGGSN